MAEYDGEIQNGLRKSSRRKNSAAKPKRRNGTTKAGAISWAKKNGMKVVSKSVANGHKRKHHRKHKRRNGIAAVSRSRNGIFGNTKHDARQVISLLGGMGATKVLSGILSNFISPYIAQVGAGAYGGIIAEGVIAVFVVPPIAKKIGNPSDAQNARLGGLAVVGLSLIEKFGGGGFLSGLSPFNSSPIVMAGNTPLLTPQAASQLVANTSASRAEKAVVAGAMQALAAGRPISNNMGRVSRIPISPLYD